MEQVDPVLDELGKIDYLLDQLARAVERGEIQRDAYDSLSPRYLERRGVLVGILERRNARLNPMPPALEVASVPIPTSALAPASPPLTRSVAFGPEPTPHPSSGTASTAYAPAQPGPTDHVPRASAPVPWTTILLFLGAFMVIVASAIFAVSVWDVMPVGGKLAFLGTLTAGFYLAGWWARAKLDLKVGSTALTTVASAMLLFDGWIAIDGYNLQGPLPWAFLLLGCSVAYWITEVRLEERFFGVAGAAAQIGWWWLLMLELQWAMPARIAGLVLVALAWQFAADRGRGSPSFGPLATILEWAAPIVAVGGVAALVPAAVANSLVLADVASAAIACGCALGVVLMSDLVPQPRTKRLLGALLQLPIFLYAWGVSFESGASGWLVCGLLALAIAYDVLAVTTFGAPFAVIGMLAEFSFVLELCRLFDVSFEVGLCAIAALAAFWILSSWLTTRLSSRAQRADLAEIALVAEVGTYVLLGVASVASIAHSVFSASPAERAVEAVVLLAVWVLALLLRRREAVLFPTAAWSFYSVYVVVGLLAPSASPGALALCLLGAAALWLALSRALESVWTTPVVTAFAWVVRASALAIAVLGVFAELASEAGTATYLSAGLTFAAALLFALDSALLDQPASSGVAAFALVLAAFQFGVALVGPVNGEPALQVAWAAGMCAGVTALLLAVVASLLREISPLRARIIAATAPVAALVTAASVADHSVVLAALLGLTALSWALGAFALGQEALLPAALTGVAALCAGLAAVQATPAETTVALAVAGLLLGGPSLAEPFGPRGRWSRAGLMLLMAGMTAQAILLPMGSASDLAPAAWWAVGRQGIAIGLFALAVNLLMQGAVRRNEYAYYLGFAAILFGVWTEFVVFDLQNVELFSTTLAAYFVLAGVVYVLFDRTRTFPLALDWAAVLVGLGVPLVASLQTAGDLSGLSHVLWAVGLSLLAIGAGVFFKARAYFFGGVFALAAVVFYRSFFVLAAYWWLWLGLLGVVLLAVALTWERQRVLVTRVQASFLGWR